MLLNLKSGRVAGYNEGQEPLVYLKTTVQAVASAGCRFVFTDGHGLAIGRPFKETSFGNWFRDRCNEAGLKHCLAHGLRKAGAKIAAENGATSHQLIALFGWEKLEQAELYTRQANKTLLAAEAMHLVVPREKTT